MNNEGHKIDEPETFPLHADLMLTALDNKIEVYEEYVWNLKRLLDAIENRAASFDEADGQIREFAGDVSQYIRNAIEGAQNAKAFAQARLDEIKEHADEFVQIEKAAPQPGANL